MSATTIQFKADLLIGEQTVPLLSQLALGDTDSQDGITNGFIFKLNREPFAEPVTVYLGDVIKFINNKLGGDVSSSSSGTAFIFEAIPSLGDDFSEDSQAYVDVYEFSINSSTSEFLFSFNLDVESSDPSTGLIALPSALTGWMSIESLSVTFTATTKSDS